MKGIPLSFILNLKGDTMDLLQRMNRTIAHIENHLTSPIAFSELAKHVMCSVYHYQRMFSFIAGVPLSEYIRRRRLTVAAYDLQNTSEPIIEIAYKYGYDSPEAFSRAFKNLHGVTPTSARNGGVTLKSYPPISFTISVKGDTEMTYRIEKLDAFNVIGFTEKINQTTTLEAGVLSDEMKDIWDRAMEMNTFDKLWQLKKEARALKGILGLFSDGEWGQNSHLGLLANRLHIKTSSTCIFPKVSGLFLKRWVLQKNS
jgi:AraC family transcriptional regulator